MKTSKIFLLRDELSQVQELEQAIERLGYAICSAVYLGKESLQTACAFHADLALIDACLAGKMDGLEAGRLRLPAQNVPVVYFVLAPDPEAIERAEADLPLGFITLDLPDEVLKASIEIALNKYRVELLREESEEKFRMIFENAPLMIDLFDEQGRCMLWNHACVQILGWTQEEVNADADPFQLFYPNPQERQVMKENFHRADGKFREYQVWARDQSIHTQLWADFRLPNGPVISIGHDITERKRNEEELKNTAITWKKSFLTVHWP